MHVKLQKIGPAVVEGAVVIDRFPFVIGRRSEADCSLPLACVSRRHCQFTQEGEQVLVQDLESYNGTFVNGKRALTPLPLQHGDELCLGPIPFRVLVEFECPETEVCLGKTKGEESRLECPSLPGA